MRAFFLSLVLASLLAVPGVAANESMAEPAGLTLYGHVLDPATGAGEITPYDPMKEWYSPGICALPNGYVPAPAMDCQRIVYTLNAKTVRELPFTTGDVHLTFYLSADFILVPTTLEDNGVTPPVEDAGAIPRVNVEAVLSIDGQEAGKAQVEGVDVVTGPDGAPTAFELAFAPQVASIPAGAPVTLTIQWWQVETPTGVRTGMTQYNVHEGGDYNTLLVLPVTAGALEFLADSVTLDLDAMCADASLVPKHLRKVVKPLCAQAPAPASATLVDGSVLFAFENPPVDLEELAIHLQGPAEAKALTDPFSWTAAGVPHIGVIWDHAADGADPAAYTAHVMYEGASVAELGLEKALGLDAGGDLPGPSFALVALALVGAAAVALRRRV